LYIVGITRAMRGLYLGPAFGTNAYGTSATQPAIAVLMDVPRRLGPGDHAPGAGRGHARRGRRAPGAPPAHPQPKHARCAARAFSPGLLPPDKWASVTASARTTEAAMYKAGDQDGPDDSGSASIVGRGPRRRDGNLVDVKLLAAGPVLRNLTMLLGPFVTA